MSALGVLAVGTGVVSTGAALLSLFKSFRHLGYAGRDSRPQPSGNPQTRPEVTLIVPCCGDEAGLESNLDALLGQEYEPFHVRFVVRGTDDGAVPAIERARGRYPGRSDLIAAGPGEGQGQKVHNLLAALDASPLAEVIVFADSDGRPGPGWLDRLVHELEGLDVGVASSYRFYRPVPATLATLLRSVWNLSTLALLGDHDRNFAWGGSMAMRADVFTRAGVREAWHGALSDDYALTHAVRRAGLRVAFVPEALVGSEGDVRMGSVLSWAARQISITRVYWPALFRLAAASSLCSAACLVLAPLAGGTLPLALLIASLGMGSAAGGLRAVAVARLDPRWRPGCTAFSGPMHCSPPRRDSSRPLESSGPSPRAGSSGGGRVTR
jgi:cellulose synthase/poly-beta-1,6-N-acetylglucosamine synthase-like glycosyltransferase